MAAVATQIMRQNMRTAHFLVSKADTLADEQIDISLHELPPLSKITLHCEVLMRKKHRFSAYAYHHSDARGSLLTSVDPSIGGTYTGVDPMGLIWSFLPEKTERNGLRYLPDIFEPLELKLNAYIDHVEDFTRAEKLAETTIRRHWIADSVDCQHVRHGQLRGILFTPKDRTRKYPAIVDIYGSGGGIMPHRAALMAAKGFVTFSLAFFRYEDLAPTMLKLNLDYFVDAVNYLRQMDCVQTDGIGAIGLSKGADLMVEAAALTPHIKALAFINGFTHNQFCTLYWQGKVHRKPIPIDWSYAREDEEKNLVLKDCHVIADLPESQMIPVERVNGNIGFFISCADENVPSLPSALMLMRKMKNHGREADCQLFKFEGAGHILEPAYMPFCSAMYMPHMGGHVNAMGGTPALHHKCQLRYWPLLLEFFKTNLCDSVNTCKAKL